MMMVTSSHYFNNLTSLHSRLLCWKSLRMTHVLNLEDFFAQRSGKRDEKECFSLIFSWCTDWLPQLFCCGQIKLSSWLADVYLPRISLFHSILFWMFSMNLWLLVGLTNCTWVSYKANRNSTFSKLLGSFHVNGHWLFHLFLPSLHHDKKKVVLHIKFGNEKSSETSDWFFFLLFEICHWQVH